MIKINLLSPVDKLNLKWEKSNRLIMDNFFILFLIQILVIIIFIATLEYIDIESKNLTNSMESLQLKSEAKEINTIKRGVKKYENKLLTYENLEEIHTNWLNVLEDVANITPNGVRMNNISIKPKSEVANSSSKRKPVKEVIKKYDELEIVIIGESKTMNDLLLLEENLKNSKVFLGFSVNPGNYDNNNFKYNLTMKK